MATLIENMVEAVIEDPVVDILAEPDTVSQVPALNSGPVGRRGRPQQSGGAVLSEERSSDTSDPNQSDAAAPDTSSGSDDQTPPNEMPDESGGGNAP